MSNVYTVQLCRREASFLVRVHWYLQFEKEI